jgi:hypothetical protein
MNTNKEEIYPFCYKIKETCLPCNETPCPSCNNTYCLEELSNFNKKNMKDKTEKEKDIDNLFNCLKKYGDIYKKLDIELYVNPKTQKITFPINSQIQSKYNMYLNNIDFNTKSPKIGNMQDEKLMLFNILLNDNLRNAYNNFYYSNGFSELDSLLPKKYGIARIMDTEYDEEGGRRIKKYIKTKNKKNYKKYIKTKKRRKTNKKIKR